jgi:hypothetical protein
VSHEKIRFHLHNPPAGLKVESLLLTVREQFYPFKSRDKRNRILACMAPAPKSNKRDVEAAPIAHTTPVSS